MSEAGGPGGIDVRAPRFVAGITAGLLAVAFVLALLGADAVGSPARFFDPGFLLTAIIALLFLWGSSPRDRTVGRRLPSTGRSAHLSGSGA